MNDVGTDPYNPRLPPLFWQEYTSQWGIEFVVASTGQQALTLHLPIAHYLHTTDFALALTIGYQLEAGRDLIHRTSFVLDDLRVMTPHYQRIPIKGSWRLTPVETLPAGTGKGALRLLKKEDLTTANAN